MDSSQSLIAELEDAIQSGSKDRRVNTLRRITDLFVNDADRLNDAQIDVFDDVLGHLIKRIEGRALTELGQRLGPVKNAPIEIVRSLARNDNIDVAEPILRQSIRLSDEDLIEIAGTKAQGHLLAISERTQIPTNVTDVLLRRGDRQVFHRLAENSGAAFSEGGFATLVSRAESDTKLAEKVGLRLDVPLRLFRELLLRATEAVRTRLLGLAGPESRDHIQRVLASITEDVNHEASIQNQHDFSGANTRVLAIQKEGGLNDGAIFNFAKTSHYAEMIVGLALMCGAPYTLVDDLLHNDSREAYLIPCKAAGLAWSTVRAVLNCPAIGQAIADHDIDRIRGDYTKLTRTSAQRVLRFWQVRQSASKDGGSLAAMG